MLEFGVRSDRGEVRQINEDSYNILINKNQKPYCFIIADGMGGHNSGEVASKMVVELMTEYIQNDYMKLLNGENISDIMKKMIKKANKEVFNNANSNISNRGMGTTLLLAYIRENKIFIGHVGDSRAYRIRENQIQRVTTDHSYVEELVQTGKVTREEAEKHPKKNIVTRAIGCFENVEIDTSEYNMVNGDIYLLCTDGLTNMLNENTIKEVVNRSKHPQKACNKLIHLTNEKGGYDNTTIIIFSG